MITSYVHTPITILPPWIKKSDPEREFDEKAQEILNLIYALEASTLVALSALVNEFRLAVIAAFNAIEEPLDIGDLVNLRQRVELAGNAFNVAVEQLADTELHKMADLGIRSVRDAATAEGIDVRPSPIEIQVVQQRQVVGELIRNVTVETRQAIDAIVSDIAIGNLSIRDGKTAVGLALGDQRGVFRSTAARAEVIVRTELLRLSSIAAHAQMIDTQPAAARLGYTLLKWWLTAGDLRVRQWHIEAGIAYSPERAIPITEPFVVGGENLMYPRAPEGSAGNVVNCRCFSTAKLKRGD